MKVLNAVNDDVLSTEYCYKGEAAGVCQPPWTLMDMLKEHNSDKLKKMMQNDELVQGIFKIFLGADADFKKGTSVSHLSCCLSVSLARSCVVGNSRVSCLSVAASDFLSLHDSLTFSRCAKHTTVVDPRSCEGGRTTARLS